MSLLRLSSRLRPRAVVHVHSPLCGCGAASLIAYRTRGARSFSSSSSACASASASAPLGFIGLGHMGGHMAHNLMKAGHSLVVFDLSPQSLDRVREQAKALGRSVTVADSPKQVGAQSSRIVTMLPSSPHVLSVYTGSDGILAGLKANPSFKPKEALLIDSSTIDPSTARQVSQQAREQLDVLMLDAPVSGGVGGAEAGTLTFMVGCPEQAFPEVSLLLKHMGKNIVHCGDSGTGQIAKVCNNVVLGMSMVAVAEGMSLGVKLGMDPVKLAGIFNTSSARCWSSDTYNPCPGVLPGVPSSRGYTGGFGTALMLKDMGLAVDAGKAIGHHMPLSNLTKEVYEDIVKQGNAGKDFSFVYEYLKQYKTKQ